MSIFGGIVGVRSRAEVEFGAPDDAAPAAAM
jgi:hypothetical protein